MRTLANILWHFPFLGFLSALTTFLIGGLFVITVVGAPIGLGLIQLSKFLLTPFSSAMVSKKDLEVNQNEVWVAYSLLIRIIYFPFGLILTLVTVFQIVGLFVSIIGIPVAIVLAKSLGTYFNPVHKICVHRSVEAEIFQKKAKQRVA
jgi:uncharacterized membrane protein YccF (DUF307 family)